MSLDGENFTHAQNGIPMVTMHCYNLYMYKIIIVNFILIIMSGHDWGMASGRSAARSTITDLIKWQVQWFKYARKWYRVDIF